MNAALIVLPLAIVLAAAPTSAAYRYRTAAQMAQRSGEVIGAAAGCGVSEERLLAVSRTVIEMIQELPGASERDLDRARRIFERANGAGAAIMRAHQDQCPAAIADFVRAEQNQADCGSGNAPPSPLDSSTARPGTPGSHATVLTDETVTPATPPCGVQTSFAPSCVWT